MAEAIREWRESQNSSHITVLHGMGCRLAAAAEDDPVAACDRDYDQYEVGDGWDELQAAVDLTKRWPAVKARIEALHQERDRVYGFLMLLISKAGSPALICKSEDMLDENVAFIGQRLSDYIDALNRCYEAEQERDALRQEIAEERAKVDDFREANLILRAKIDRNRDALRAKGGTP